MALWVTCMTHESLAGLLLVNPEATLLTTNPASYYRPQVSRERHDGLQILLHYPERVEPQCL